VREERTGEEEQGRERFQVERGEVRAVRPDEIFVEPVSIDSSIREVTGRPERSAVQVRTHARTSTAEQSKPRYSRLFDLKTDPLRTSQFLFRQV
jgi:hypothetical protein